MINLKEEAETLTGFNQLCHQTFLKHKGSLLVGIKNDAQRLMTYKYFDVLNELCIQASNCLNSRAYSASEALTRVIIEQSANHLYIALDDGRNARALLKRSKKLTLNNGNNWVEHLTAQGIDNPAAKARQRNGEALVQDFEKRWPDTGHYPNAKELFKALGWTSHYHAYYAPLCDSVHTFSDDMANLVGIFELYEQSAQDGAEVLAYWEQERRRLATYHCAVAIGLRYEAFARICDRLDSVGVLEAVLPAVKKLQALIDRHEQYDHVRVS